MVAQESVVDRVLVILRRRDVKDALALIGLTVIVYAVTTWTDLFDLTFNFAEGHKDWEVDDILMVAIVMGFALLIYSFRRNQDLTREIKARRAAEKAADDLARHDSLTGLPNRRGFHEKLDQVLAEIAVTNKRCAVLMLDLDGFKAINDLHGHAAGDSALIAFAERILTLLRHDTFLARLSGDEFAIICDTMVSLECAAALARRIVGAMAAPILIDNAPISLGVGIGIAIAPDDGKDHAELMRRADLALYRAKGEGRSMIRFYEEEMDTHVERRARIEHDLRAAIANHTLTMAYQPLMRLDSDGLVGFEALARWTSPELGSISPMDFIGIAEDCGMIHELGDHLLRIACAEAARWPRPLMLSFNLSPLQLRDPTLGLRILAILGETGLDPARLELEITESALLHDAELARTTIDELRATGIRFALDDFGTGYATLSQLLSLRFDKIKIDQSFVQGLGRDKESDVIVKATIGLGHNLGLVTTAEGIEDADQLAQLKASGCIEGQGFLLARPMPAKDIPALLAQFQARDSALSLAAASH